MTYQELIEQLHSSKPNPHYYHLLIDNSKLIIVQVAITNQGVVARELGMSSSAFNTLYQILKEYSAC